MTEEITETIERNLTHLFDELDELAWHDGEYNPYIELDIKSELVGTFLYEAYLDYIEAGEVQQPIPDPVYWLDQDGERWDVVDGSNLRVTAGPLSATLAKEKVEALWGPLVPGYELEVEEFDDLLYDLVFGQE